MVILPSERGKARLAGRASVPDPNPGLTLLVAASRQSSDYQWWQAPESAYGAEGRAAVASKEHRRRWRDFETATGRRPVKEFIAALSDQDAAAVAAAMKDVAQQGVAVARHLRGDIYEVRADGEHQSFRVLFSVEGQGAHVLLALEAFSKKTQKAPAKMIELAERRLSDWRARAPKP